MLGSKSIVTEKHQLVGDIINRNKKVAKMNKLALQYTIWQ